MSVISPNAPAPEAHAPRKYPLKAVAPFYFVYLIPLVVLLGATLRGPWAFSGLIFAFVITPALDAIVRVDVDNGLPADPKYSEGHLGHRLAVWLWLPCQLALVAWGATQAGTFAGHEWAGFILSIGLVSSVGINAAHELMHRRDKLSRALAEILMTITCYPHFCVEHILGHHVRVATPEDPASAPKGMGIYRFLPRTVWGSLRSAWVLETARVRRRDIGGSLRDRRLRYTLGLLTAMGASLWLGGALGLVFFVAQGVVGFLFLEVINYVEHYGLRREERAPGRYEPVGTRHSWNSPHRVTRFYLFSLPRHADHHHQPSRPYWRLRHIDDSPQLPAGYSAMVLLALVPPLWRRVMDARVDAVNGAR